MRLKVDKDGTCLMNSNDVFESMNFMLTVESETISGFQDLPTPQCYQEKLCEAYLKESMDLEVLKIFIDLPIIKVGESHIALSKFSTLAAAISCFFSQSEDAMRPL